MLSSITAQPTLATRTRGAIKSTCCSWVCCPPAPPTPWRLAHTKDFFSCVPYKGEKKKNKTVHFSSLLSAQGAERYKAVKFSQTVVLSK